MMKNLKFKFKTIFIALVFIASSFLLSACTAPSNDLSLANDAAFSHVVVRGGEETFETFSFNSNALTLLSQGEKTNLVSSIFSLFQTEGQILHGEIQNRLKEDEEIKNAFIQNSESFRIGVENGTVTFLISYKTSDLWNAVSAKSERTKVETKKSFLTITRFDRKEKIGTIKVVDDQEVYFADYLIEKSTALFSNEVQNVYNDVLVKSSYTYATTSRRRHSNADVLAYAQGFYYHQWDISANGKILFYSTVARASMWYMLALAVGGLTLGIVFGKVKLDEARTKQNLIKFDQTQDDLIEIKINDIVDEKQQQKEEIKPEVKQKKTRKTAKPVEEGKQTEAIKKPRKKTVKAENDEDNKPRIKTKDE